MTVKYDNNSKTATLYQGDTPVSSFTAGKNGTVGKDGTTYIDSKGTMHIWQGDAGAAVSLNNSVGNSWAMAGAVALADGPEPGPADVVGLGIGIAGTISAAYHELTSADSVIRAAQKNPSSGKVSTGEGAIKAGDKTPGGREFTSHGAEQANNRGFSSEEVDKIIDHNAKSRVKEISKNGKTQWRYQDKRGNTVVTNEWGDKIVTTYSHPGSMNGGNFIPKN